MEDESKTDKSFISRRGSQGRCRGFKYYLFHIRRVEKRQTEWKKQSRQRAKEVHDELKRIYCQLERAIRGNGKSSGWYHARCTDV